MHAVFLFLCICAGTVVTASAQAWTRAAADKGPMSVEEARLFMRRLTDHAVTHHMKRDSSPQRGMMYEYVWWKQRGSASQFIQGEALDTMHDGAWFACAMANAYRVTGDGYFKEILVNWQLPFYLKMLNRGDQLFSSDRMDVREEARDTWKSSKEWLLQGRENGFVPYWWDDGRSVSLEMLRKKSERPFFPCTNEFAGLPNPEFRLKGYSHGSSNHLAQDLAILLQQAWWVLRKSDAELAGQCATAARNLQECRSRHGSSNIPGVMATCALLNQDEALMKRVNSWDKESEALLRNHFTRAVSVIEPGKKRAAPGFADDDMYLYYAGVAKHKGMPGPLAFKLAFDAFTQPLLWQIYSDDAPVPPGINRFDLTTLNFVDGKPEHFRSERKGPRGGALPIGSRMGPQNMVVCGWALQAMRDSSSDSSLAERVSMNVEDVWKTPPNRDVRAWLERELGGGLRTWAAIFDDFGYIPTGIGCQSALPGVIWDEFSDTGGYAHLISAAAMWILYREGKRDWELWSQ